MPSAPARPGMIVVDSSLRVLASNAEVLQILTFPERPEKINNLEAWLNKKVHASLSESNASSGFKAKVQSARRTYVCRSYPLDVAAVQPNGGGQSGGLAIVLIERKSNGSATIAEISERFGLTAREQETVQFLRQGFTSKEIAQRMKISPNTVKAFVRLVMVKMGVSTRSGIIGKVVCPDSEATAPRPLTQVPQAGPRKLRAFAGEVQNRY